MFLRRALGSLTQKGVQSLLTKNIRQMQTLTGASRVRCQNVLGRQIPMRSFFKKKETDEKPADAAAKSAAEAAKEEKKPTEADVAAEKEKAKKDAEALKKEADARLQEYEKKSVAELLSISCL